MPENYPDMNDALNGIASRLDALAVERNERLAEAIKERGPQNGWVRGDAIEVFTLDDKECWITKPNLWDELDEMKALKEMKVLSHLSVGYNGYVRFTEKPVIEPGLEGIITYVPVHGGITYAVHDELGSVYGFDTAHHNSGEYPIRDVDWIKKQLLLMILGIKMAATIEKEYLCADGDNEKRAQLVQPLVELDDELNIGVMLNLFSGDL